jgi:hypothetical protein
MSTLLAAETIVSQFSKCSAGCPYPNTKIRAHATVVLSVVLYGCETWSVTLREEQRLKVFENSVLRTIFGPKRDEATGNGEDCITRNLMTCTHHQILFR